MAIGLVTVGAAVAQGVEGRPPAPSPEPYAEVNLSAARKPVTAEALWSSSVEVLDCMDARGVATEGPYPRADGSGVDYAYVASNKADQVEIDCGLARESLSMRFSSDADPVEAEKLDALAADLTQCLSQRGVRLDHRSDQVSPDIAFQKAGETAPDAVRECARSLVR
ncbi:MAG TPA: hypothetical protein VGO60_18170 [Iamia sp.]|nr:hypothetical protein [Iamia sp.]